MTYNKKEWIQKQESTKKELKRIMDEFIPKLIVNPKMMDKYLENLNGFYNYSLYNQICASYEFYIIHEQAPELFATFNTWKQHGRYVKRGQKGVHMIRPQKYTYKTKNDDDEEEEHTGLSFKPFVVFDISQTSGEPLVKSDLVKGKSQIKYEDAYKNVSKIFKIVDSPLELQRGATDGSQIYISNKLSENEKIATLAHEVAHNFLGHFKRDIERSFAELEAESCSYMVTTLLGLDNQKAALYINNWRNQRDSVPDEVKERSSLIIKTSQKIVELFMS